MPPQRWPALGACRAEHRPVHAEQNVSNRLGDRYWGGWVRQVLRFRT